MVLQILKTKNINLEALTMKTLCNDSYLLIGGCKGKCCIYSIDGIKLNDFEDKHSWIWASAVHPHSKFIVSLFVFVSKMYLIILYNIFVITYVNVYIHLKVVPK